MLLSPPSVLRVLESLMMKSSISCYVVLTSSSLIASLLMQPCDSFPVVMIM